MPCTEPAGNADALVPAPLGIDVAVAGMLYTIQCHQPLPVGASGSYTVIAKLFVPAGAPVHLSVGETFWPVHPKPLNTSFIVRRELPGTSGLVRCSLAFAAGLAC